MFVKQNWGICLFCILFFVGCKFGEKEVDTTEPTKLITVKAPNFNENFAYQSIEKQLSFGYRIPGTADHKKCAAYLLQQLTLFCDTVYVQKGTVKNFDGKMVPITNFIGAFKPKHKQRAMLASHWDSRPYADNDPNSSNHNKPLLGANDGASGVGVLLSLAQQLKQTPPPHGVDIVFFDAEDLGKSQYENSFCLGSQYWGLNKHTPNYFANYGVLLDMVGAPNAEFGREQFSEKTASYIMQHVWGIASELGYSGQFVNDPSGPITDDHFYVNKLTQIPMIDIIQFDRTKGFAHYWHTVNDDMSNIDKKTLKAVGTVITNLVFNPPFEVSND